MKIYKVDYRAEGYTSRGFSFHSSKREADQAGRSAMKAAQGAEEDIASFEVELIEVQPTRRGIVETLNRHAKHPDNG